MSSHSHVTLSNTAATRISPAGTHSGADLTIQNIDTSAIVYIGAEGVTADNYGFKLEKGTAISFELPPKDAIFCISDTDGSKVAVMKIGLED